MYWKDEGYLLSKNSFNENSIIIETFTSMHGKYSGIVYGGSSSKQKKNFQIGNKILLNWKSKGENKPGYFSIELVKPVSPRFFDDKKRSISILSATSILKILLPERQINQKIYSLFEKLIDNLHEKNWIKSYIFWEFSLIKELGFEIDFSKDKFDINGKSFNIPEFLIYEELSLNKNQISEALEFNKNLLNEIFVIPNKLRFPNYRSVLEKYFQ
jgi:DNA repair protein RecO (recombination protein O)